MIDLFGEEQRETRKNFSRNNLGQRRAGDFYQTPPSMTRQFLDVLPIRRLPVLEPAEGSAAITAVLRERYGRVWVKAYDIVRGHDFLEESRKIQTIITNPPFSLSTEFILKCKDVARHRFSLLMPLEYLHGSERFARIFSVRDDWRLAFLHVYTRRAMLSHQIRNDGKYETGMITWAWFTWLRRPWWMPRAEPRVRWIDNDEYVLRSRS